MEELKHYIEHNVASTGPEILRKVARNTLKIADFFSEKVIEIFSICCKAVFKFFLTKKE
jgi:hypothetical protein